MKGATPPPDLLDRASRGDAHAIEELIQAHLPGLRAFVRLRAGKVVRARESCSDLVQSVCRELLHDLPNLRFEGGRGFKRWLYQAAERKIIDRARYWQAGKRDVQREITPRSDGDTASRQRIAEAYRAIATPSQDLQVREEIERVESAFDALPEHYREVITLSRLAGLSHAEIAARMGRSEGAVRTLLCRALAELSEQLQ
jgi:RNA polymerase sigma-70 factor (ECF subfamily)